jgi:nonribosomal peptide synthetase DhbF
VFPLSYAQQRLWFFSRLEGPNSIYNVPLVLRMNGQLDVDALGAALGDVIERHEVLRTVLGEVDGEQGQRILPAAELGFTLRVIQTGREGYEPALREIIKHPFNLDGDVLIRGALLRMAADEHVLALVIHHAVCDGWSLTPLLRDLEVAYRARRSGQEPGWEPLPVQYSDFTLWQRELLGSADDAESLLAKQLGYWRDTLAGLPEQLDLPFDRPRTQVAGYQGHQIPFQVPPNVHANLIDIGRQEQATLFMVLQSALAAMLSRMGAGTDIPIGTPIAGRTDAAMSDLIGFFVNTLVLRTDVSGRPTFRQLVRRTRESTLTAFAHQDVPFERLVEELNPARSLARNPLFQVELALHSGDLTIALPQIDTVVEVAETQVARFDVSFGLQERYAADGRPLGLGGVIECATDLFDADTAAALAERFVRYLGALAEDPYVEVSSVDVLTPSEADLLRGWNDSAHELPDQTVTTTFEQRAGSHPDAIALVCGDERFSYAELNVRVNRFAHHLISLGVVPDAVVAVAVPRSAEAVIAWLAIGKAGGVYMPIDIHNPVDRIRALLTDAKPAVLVTTDALAASIRTLPVVMTDLDPDAAEHNPTVAVRLDHAAYVIYTSGSTGQPKGVTVLHRALTNLLAFHSDVTFCGPQRRRVALSASLAFDTSWEGVLAMISGHELHLLEEQVRRDPARMVDYIAAKRIEQIDVTPSFAQQLLIEGLLAPGSTLATLMLGGEFVGEALWSELRSAVRTKVYNYYGPSEFCVEASGCALAEIDQTSVGRPVYNSRVFVLDEHLNQVPPGVLGEIYLAGANLGRGYLHRPAMTAERFVANPFGAPGDRMYRSGDLGRWTADGYLLFAGRADDQVKLRGFRIELGEIETTIATSLDVADVAVIMREDVPGERRIVAYVVATAGRSLDTGALREIVATALPDYMVPAAFVELDALPLTRNSKLDRNALPVPTYGSQAAGRMPTTELELAVAELFAEILRVESVSLDDDFFELGGHSLLATRLVNRIRTVLGTDVNLMQVFEQPTVAGVVASLKVEEKTARPALVRQT